MKFWVVTLIAAVMSLAVAAQTSGRSPFCPSTSIDKDVLVNICTHERGMAPLVQPRLFFRLHATGLGEFEVDSPAGLVTRTMQLSAEETRFVKDVIALPDMKSVKDEYPVFRRFIDSSMETRLLVRFPIETRAILLRNFTLDDYDVATKYPAALVVLVRTLRDHRDRAVGVVKHIPQLSFTTMINYPDYDNREILIYADYEHRYTVLATGKIVNEQDVLYDHESDSTMVIAMKFDGKPNEIEAAKKVLEKAETERFGGRARLLLRGRFDETVDTFTRNRIRTFYAYEVKDIEPIDLPFHGSIKLGWNYVHTFEQRNAGGEFDLVLPLKLPIHHAGRIEWRDAKKFPQLAIGGLRRIVFRATTRTTEQITPGRWNETFHCTILEAH